MEKIQPKNYVSPYQTDYPIKNQVNAIDCLIIFSHKLVIPN